MLLAAVALTAVVAALAVPLGAGRSGATDRDLTPARLGTATTDAGRGVVARDATSGPGRTAAVRELLDRRAAAVLARDRDAFLATVDPHAPAFAGRQAALFDALAEVPLSSWRYELDPTREADPGDLATRHDAPVWLPQVVLRYGHPDDGTAPLVASQVLTLVLRPEGWRVAADDEVETPVRTARALWDHGPVVAVTGRRVLVLGHPEQRAVLERLAEETDRVVPDVTAAWGEDWSQRVVVLVPRDHEELDRLLDGQVDTTGLAALAVAQREGGDPRRPVGDRVVVAPEALARLGPVGRRVVLTHEVVHLATRRSSAPPVPLWLVEGYAHHVAHRAAGVEPDPAGTGLARAVAAAGLPDSLPGTDGFRGAEDLTVVYELARLAVADLAERYGDDGVVRLYRRLRAEPAGRDPDAAWRDALREVLGTTPEAVLRDWRAAVARAVAPTADGRPPGEVPPVAAAAP